MLLDWNRERDLRRLARRHLDAVEEDSGTAGADVPGSKGLQGSVDDGQITFAVEPIRYFNAGFAREGGALGAGVKVTERAAAHGGRLAMDSAGHDVTAFLDHVFLSCGIGGAPLPLRGVWGKLPIFNGLEAGFYRKLSVLRNFEPKLLKTDNLRRLACGMEPGATPPVRARYPALIDILEI